jgi:hypothetical protein
VQGFPLDSLDIRMFGCFPFFLSTITTFGMAGFGKIRAKKLKKFFVSTLSLLDKMVGSTEGKGGGRANAMRLRRGFGARGRPGGIWKMEVVYMGVCHQCGFEKRSEENKSARRVLLAGT